MKKVLLTGASGSIGEYVIKFLLSEGKYEITALDLRNKKTQKKLKKYHKRINIIFGDINDSILMEALVKDHDIIIHLAGVMPPLGEFTNACEIIDYNGTETIIKAINYYNKDCHLIYASTTSMYSKEEASVKDKIDDKNISKYALAKYKTECLIKKKLKNYTIFRLPLVLNNIKDEPFMYNIKKDTVVEVTTNYDAAYAFVKSLDYLKTINRKTFNVSMGEKGRIEYIDILRMITKNYGISMKHISLRIILEKNFNSPTLKDSENLEKIIHYQSDTLYNYSKRLKRFGKNRKLQVFIGKLCYKKR